jgi:glycosyltransferase involved in cell wall biosynthesis
LLFVNDGSRDGSLQKIKEAVTRHADLMNVSSDQNNGLSSAMKAGIGPPLCKYLGDIDADLQTTPDDFDLLLQNIAAMRWCRAYCQPQDRDSSASSRSLPTAYAASYGDTATDTGCRSSSCGRRWPADTLLRGMHRFRPHCFPRGGHFKEMPVRQFPRTAVCRMYHLWKPLRGLLSNASPNAG